MTGSCDPDPFHQPRFFDVFQRDNTPVQALPLSFQNHGKDSPYRLNIPIQPQLACHQRVLYILLGQDPQRHKNPRRHRKIVGGSFFMEAGGRYIHGDADRRKHHLCILQRHTDALPGLFHLAAQKAHHLKAGQSPGYVHFHPGQIAFHTMKPSGINCTVHFVSPYQEWDFDRVGLLRILKL